MTKSVLWQTAYTAMYKYTCKVLLRNYTMYCTIIIMPRAEAYGSSFVCLSVCLSVIPSVSDEYYKLRISYVLHTRHTPPQTVSSQFID